MIAIILAIYFFIILFYAVTYFFITYHFVRYSINASLNKLLLPIFILGSIFLLISNVLLFFSINWNSLISKIPNIN